MRITELIKLKQVQHVMSEKTVLADISHPFIVKLIPPFYDEKPFGIYHKILSAKIDFPRNLDRTAKDLIKKLLVQDRTRRLGNMKNGSSDVKNHKWFKEISWDDAQTAKTKSNPKLKTKAEGVFKFKLKVKAKVGIWHGDPAQYYNLKFFAISDDIFTANSSSY
ncbi:PRKX [Bugula neritina]|uniref:PRKX n=1 Tax=Bugula neritina TaxID=10212 RepID=A0A7J7JH91_BUGNE|nr:PRKX [Bugula neritina]